jgi:gamma-glutamyl hercynylcysteine S-oxide synthase
LNMNSSGFNDKLFQVERKDNIHYISLWNHEIINPEISNRDIYIRASADGWDSSLSGTRREGSVDCIAALPMIINSEITGDSIRLRCNSEGSVTIWKGNPAIGTEFSEVRLPCDTTLRIKDLFGYYEGKIVLQLINNKQLKDEAILRLAGGKPWLISKKIPTKRSEILPPDMVLVPGSRFSFNPAPGEEFIPYPDHTAEEVMVDSFLIDRYPVTNAQFYEFIITSGYRPADTSGYLRHWQAGSFKQGQDKYPVVNVSYEDMSAYAKWAGKRLPTEAEWQLAAQGNDNRKWPWGNEFHGTNCNNSFGRLTPVDAFPKGQSPFGAQDMVGNVWQMTGDIYFNGSNYIGIIRGGSYYKPDSSWWYLQGGPQTLDKTQILLMVSPGFDRSATVGFRCAKDIDTKNFSLRK